MLWYRISLDFIKLFIYLIFIPIYVISSNIPNHEYLTKKCWSNCIITKKSRHIFQNIYMLNFYIQHKIQEIILYFCIKNQLKETFWDVLIIKNCTAVTRNLRARKFLENIYSTYLINEILTLKITKKIFRKNNVY